VSRNVVLGFLAVSVTGLGLMAVLSTPALQRNETLTSDCDQYLGAPTAGWVSLSNCLLDMEALVLESEHGEFETLENRRNGLSSKLLSGDGPPNWVAAWAPMRQDVGRVGVIRVVYRLQAADLLKWLNTFDRADERTKERMWVDPVLLRRMARPSVVEGRAEKPPTDAIQRAYGNVASATMLTLLPGKAPKSSVLGPIVALSMLVALGLTIARLARKPPPGIAEASVEQLGVHGVKLEYGALDALRREEQAEKRRRKARPDPP